MAFFVVHVFEMRISLPRLVSNSWSQAILQPQPPISWNNRPELPRSADCLHLLTADRESSLRQPLSEDAWPCVLTQYPQVVSPTQKVMQLSVREPDTTWLLWRQVSTRGREDTREQSGNFLSTGWGTTKTPAGRTERTPSWSPDLGYHRDDICFVDFWLRTTRIWNLWIYTMPSPPACLLGVAAVMSPTIPAKGVQRHSPSAGLSLKHRTDLFSSDSKLIILQYEALPPLTGSSTMQRQSGWNTCFCCMFSECEQSLEQDSPLGGLYYLQRSWVSERSQWRMVNTSQSYLIKYSL
jgi:hypothetical protein